MQPERFRNDRGFAALGAGTALLLGSTPAYAAPFESAYMAGAAPIAIIVGALGFGVAAAILVNRWRREGAAASKSAERYNAALRAQLDEAQAILEGMPELTISWRSSREEPRVYGPAQALLPPGTPPEKVLDLSLWAGPTDVEALVGHIHELRHAGQPFDLSLTSRTGKIIRVIGRVLGGAAIMRIRPAIAQPRSTIQSLPEDAPPDPASAKALFDVLGEPAWIRDEKGKLAYANAAYMTLAANAGAGVVLRDGPPELFDPQTISTHLSGVDAASGPITLEQAFTHEECYDMVLLPLSNGSAGYLRRRNDNAVARAVMALDSDLSHIAGVINALSTPIAIFDGRRQLIQFNRAFRELWDLDPQWLRPGLTEQAILDRLRTLGQLPAEVDYRAWRTEHLKSYGLTKTRETLWHLPDGRALNVSAVPAASTGGVIYIYEDISERLALESRYNGLIHVQSETLNGLTEGVAVFGTNGRLTLHNPRFSEIWKLHAGAADGAPHIDQIGAMCATVMPDDGARIWRDLKQAIIDLNPTRADKSGRINRSDGRLLDYATVRLPDGQTLVTFADVTESANFQRVLKERNDALITADKLKDAFVQNVSYELRLPLTNIIGFAELLASGQVGPLNEQQQTYAEYIRSQSTTLGVLVDNILDLTTVDAGIAELHLAELDVNELVEQARAGVAASFASDGGADHINLEIDIADDLPRFVADPNRIIQILYNMLSNAARFSSEGGKVKLTIESRGNNHDRMVFVVEDEGTGFDEEVRAALAQRMDGHLTSPQQRGAGLGLAIVKAFANLHGGTLNLEAREPRGTRVTVNLPAIAVADDSNAAE